MPCQVSLVTAREEGGGERVRVGRGWESGSEVGGWGVDQRSATSCCSCSGSAASIN